MDLHSKEASAAFSAVLVSCQFSSARQLTAARMNVPYLESAVLSGQCLIFMRRFDYNNNEKLLEKHNLTSLGNN